MRMAPKYFWMKWQRASRAEETKAFEILSLRRKIIVIKQEILSLASTPQNKALSILLQRKPWLKIKTVYFS